MTEIPVGEDVRDYIDAIPAAHRPLFDRLHGLIVRARPDVTVVMSYKMPTYKAGGRRVLLADANPAIGGLGVATLTTLSEIGALAAADAGIPTGAVGGRPAAGPETAVNPNLGPPPSRPDWRRRTRS